MQQHSQFQLMKERRFAPFFWTQFCGAGNDNVFKVAFTMLVTYHAAEFGNINPAMASFLIPAIFIAPFVLFSATSGQLADKYEKATLMRFVKNLEIAIMLVGAAGFMLHEINLLYATTFLMGLHSTLFGPVKYAYLPQHLNESELVGGNGLVEMGTFVAILIGTVLGSQLANLPGVGPMAAAVACLVIAVIGRFTVAFVPFSPAAAPNLKINWNPLTETLRNLGIARGNRSVFLSLLGISWLWFFGATFLSAFPAFAKDVMGGDPNVFTLLLAVFSVGIGLGSMLCERMSSGKVEIGLVPFGAIGMTVFAVDLYFASRGMKPDGLHGIGYLLSHPENWRVLADLFLLAMFGGFYSVPLYALIQLRAEPEYRARIVAANNILNALFMIGSALLAMALLKVGFGIPQLFLVTGILNAVVAIYIFSVVPEFLMRFLCWLLMHTLYRLRVRKTDTVPDEGPAVLVANHVSYVDALVISAAVRRPVRFVMDWRIFQVPVLSFIFRTMRCIPVASEKDNPQIKEAAFQEIRRALQEGDLVCIFPEGKLTTTGEMNVFKNGITRIIEETPVPVIPIALRGLWGSFFSRFVEGKAFRRFRGMFSRVECVAAEAWPPEKVTPEGLREQVLAMRGDRQ